MFTAGAARHEATVAAGARARKSNSALPAAVIAHLRTCALRLWHSAVLAVVVMTVLSCASVHSVTLAGGCSIWGCAVPLIVCAGHVGFCRTPKHWQIVLPVRTHLQAAQCHSLLAVMASLM